MSTQRISALGVTIHTRIQAPSAAIRATGAPLSTGSALDLVYDIGLLGVYGEYTLDASNFNFSELKQSPLGLNADMPGQFLDVGSRCNQLAI